MKLYRTGLLQEKLIEEVEADRATNKTVWMTHARYDGTKIKRQFARHGKYDQFWDSLTEAKLFLQVKFETRIKSYESEINELKLKLKELNEY